MFSFNYGHNINAKNEVRNILVSWIIWKSTFNKALGRHIL